MALKFSDLGPHFVYLHISILRERWGKTQFQCARNKMLVLKEILKTLHLKYDLLLPATNKKNNIHLLTREPVNMMSYFPWS